MAEMQPLSDEQRALADVNRRLAQWYFYRRMRGLRHDFEEDRWQELAEAVEDACADGLLRAASSYVPERAAFSTFAVLCMESEVRRALQAMGVRGARVPAWIDAAECLDVEDGGIDRAEDAACAEDVIAHLAAHAKLTSRQADVLICRYWREMTLNAVGDALGVSLERARQVEASALKRLRYASVKGRS